MTSYQVDQILDEQNNYSSYSAEQSFTLSDILAERDEIDEEALKEKQQIIQGMFDDCFQDEEEQETAGKEEIIQTNQLLSEEKQIETPQQKNQNLGNGQLKADGKLQKSQIKKAVSSEKQQTQVIQPKPINRCKRIQNMRAPPLSEIKNISFIVLNNVTAAFDQTAKGVGIPTVIASNGVRYLAVGTSFGNVVLFEVGNKSKKILGNADNRKFGSITSIAISKEGKYLVCGQENGLITIWDLSTQAQLKKQLVTEQKIIKIIFCSQTQFLLADLEGNIFLFTIEHHFWVKIKKDRLFERTSSIFYDMKLHTLQSGIEVIVLCSLEQILVATYMPRVEAIDRLGPPEDFSQQKIPNIELGKTAILSIHNPNNKNFHLNDVLCVSWSNIILVYKFRQGIRLEKLELAYKFCQDTPIYNMEFISQGVLVTLDNRQTFRSFRIWINDQGGHQLLNEKLIPEEVIYQRYIGHGSNNNRHIKIFNNTIISCTFNPKQKQLFFICKNSIYRCRIYKWNQYISDLLINENKLQQSLKICMQIYSGRMNIFLEPIAMNEKTLKILCEVGRIYVKKRIEYIESLQIDRARNQERKEEINTVVQEVEETYDCVIEYMTSIKCVNQLFELIYLNIIKQKYLQHTDFQHVFLNCLEPFIMDGRITSLPSRKIFQELIEYYLPQNKRELIDNFIMFLDVQTLSLFYEQAILICSQNKLYRSLAYVCSTHEDFISPLNSLLNQVKTAQDHQMKSAQETYYAMLKDYIIKLLGNCYINGISFEDDGAVMKKSLSNWLMCRQTLMFFVKNEVQAYHHDYFYFIQELVYLLSGQPTLQEYIHSELRNIVKQQVKNKQKAELFIKLSQFITLDKEEVQIIIKFSDSQLISKYLDKYLHFYRLNQKELNLMENLEQFYTKNKQMEYFHHFIQANEKGQQRRILPSVNLLENSNHQLNGQLTKYILNKMSNEEALWNLEDLLKIHSENTMVFTLQRFSIETVNERLNSIKDLTYRYVVIRKILKILRRQDKKDKIKKYHAKKDGQIRSSERSSYNQMGSSKLILQRQSQISNLIEVQERQRSNSGRKRLSKQIMQFYIECLCKYKNQKRVYYELICNMNDYYDSVEEIISIVSKHSFNSCLGLLEQIRHNYEPAYKYFTKVYRQFFFEQNYKKMIKIRHCHGRFMRRIFERMLTITSIMNTEEQWMEILKCIISPLEDKSLTHKIYVCDDIQDVYEKTGKTHPFLRQLSQIIEHCLINVSNKVPIQVISSYIGQHSYVFSRMFVLQSFRATLLTYSNNAKIYFTTNEMIVNHEVAIFEEIYSHLIKGIVPNMSCLKCGKPFDQEHPMKVFLCGHTYHKWCPGDPKLGSDIIDYRYSTAYNKDVSVMDEEDLVQQHQSKCQHCNFQKAKGNTQVIDTKLPDFHKEYEENILVKGMVGIVTIIPNMISAIPGSITALSSMISPEEEMMAPPKQQTQANTALDDHLLTYLAFTQNLQVIYDQNEKFIHDCSKYFNEKSL